MLVHLIFRSFFLYILPDPPLSIMGKFTLQDESLQVTISKLPKGSLPCIRVTFSAQGTSS